MASEAGVVSGLSYPIFLISDTGVPFHEEMTNEVYVQIAGYSQNICSKIILECLRQPSQMHLLIPSEDEPQIKEMIQEGKRIIEHCLKLKHFSIFESKMPLFEMMLGNVPFAEVGEFFRYDMPTNDPDKDECSKCLLGCQARFGINAVLPYGGFPAADKVLR